MKLTRIIYYGLMPVLLLFGMYTGLTLFYTILIMQVLLLIVVFFIDVWTVKTFRYSQKLEHESAIKGSETVLRIKIVNEKPIPMSLMEIAVNVVSMRENVKLVFSLAPFSSRSFDIPVILPYRGSYEVGMTEMRITDIFGLMTLKFDMRKQSFYKMTQLLVYPKAEPLETVAARVWDTKLFGNSFLKQAEQGDSISGMREYRPGDPLKRIHWKNSVRQGQLIVKQYDIPMREKALILLDSDTKGLTGENAVFYADTMCECAASISLYNLSRGRDTRVIAADKNGKLNECRSDSDFGPIHKWLAQLPFGNEDRLEDALETLTGGNNGSSSLFVLTRRPAPSLISKLVFLQERMEAVTLILIDDEKTQNERLHTLYINTGDDVPLSLGNFS